MPKCARLRAKADAYAYLFSMLCHPSVDRLSVFRTSVFKKYYASWKENTQGTVISGGNFRKFRKFPDTNILWKFSEVPKISHCWIFSKYKCLEVEIFGSSENFLILTSYGNFRKFRKLLVPTFWRSGNFRKFRLFLSSISPCAKFLSMLVIIFSWVLIKCQFCYKDWLVCFVHLWYILVICYDVLLFWSFLSVCIDHASC